jgi:hypothetical protein
MLHPRNVRAYQLAGECVTKQTGWPYEATAVRMEDDSRWRLPGSDGHAEGGGDEAGPHVRGHGPANYFA